MRVPVLCIALAVTAAGGAPARADDTASSPVIVLAPLCAITAAANVITMTEGHPAYAMGIVGVGMGGLTLLAMAADDDHGDAGYALAGGIALGTGLMAMWHRHSLNGEAARVAMVPGAGGSPGFSLVIRF